MSEYYSIADFKLDQDTFNNIAGTSMKTSREELNNQLMLIQEEASEISSGLRKQDNVEILDGATDTLYVVLGFIQKLKNAGYDTETAMLRVAENNLSKFPKNEETAIATVEYYKQQGIECKYEYNEVYDCYVIRDSNNKVRKPLGYVPVDLSDCVPKE